MSDQQSEIERLRRWAEEASVALRAASIIGRRAGAGLNYANHDRLLREVGELVPSLSFDIERTRP